MKHLLSLVLCTGLALCASAQDRSLPSRRAFQPAPVLLTITGTQDAAGIAQTPEGHAIPLHIAPTPQWSLVGLYGRGFAGVSLVMLWHDNGVAIAPVESVRSIFPGIETIVFRLPAGVAGEVWVTTIGRQSSNIVRLTVE